MRMLLVLLCAMGAIGGSAAAATPLQFSDIGHVAAWRKGGAARVYVQDDQGHWYRADLAEACMKLDTAKGISFLTEPAGPGRRSSAVEVDRHQCAVTAIEPVKAPQ